MCSISRAEKPLLISPRAAAEIAGVHERTIVRLCSLGQLPAVKIGKSWRINRSKFLDLLGIEDA